MVHSPDAAVQQAVEFIPGRLYFIAWDPTPVYPVLRDTSLQHFFLPGPRLTYTPFNYDFGPLNISKIHLFCEQLGNKLKDERLKHKRIYFVSPTAKNEFANNALLICAYAVLHQGDSPAIALMRLGSLKEKLQPYRDASPKTNTFHLTVVDILQGLKKAHALGIYKPSSFCVSSYEHYEQVCHGDINWIVPERMYAFSGPHATKEQADSYSHSIPSDYLGYFLENNVTDVVRLSDTSYPAEAFTAHGLKLHDLSFADGTIPASQVVDEFLAATSNANGAVAVHCRAGLESADDWFTTSHIGRTGTLIALWLMREYSFNAREAIAWLRLCRPGSVMGPQQHFVLEQEPFMRDRHTQAVNVKRTAGKLPITDSDEDFAHTMSDRARVLGGGISTSSVSLAGSSGTSATGSTANIAHAANDLEQPLPPTASQSAQSSAAAASSAVECPFAHITSAAGEDRGMLAHSLEWHTQQQVELQVQQQARYQQVLARKAAQEQEVASSTKDHSNAAQDGQTLERFGLLSAPSSTGSPLRRRSISQAKKLDLDIPALPTDNGYLDPENTPPIQRKPSGRASNPTSRRSSIGTWSDDSLQAQVADAAERLQRTLLFETQPLAPVRGVLGSTSRDSLSLRSPSSSKTNSPVAKHSGRRSSMQPITNDPCTSATGEQ